MAYNSKMNKKDTIKLVSTVNKNLKKGFSLKESYHLCGAVLFPEKHKKVPGNILNNIEKYIEFVTS